MKNEVVDVPTIPRRLFVLNKYNNKIFFGIFPRVIKLQGFLPQINKLIFIYIHITHIYICTMLSK